VRIADPEKLPRILEAAARLFAERPFHEVRIEDIAARAGVAKGTLYSHFKEKEELFRAMIAEALARRLDEAQVRLLEASDPREKLQILIRESVRFSDRYPHYLELLHQLEISPPAHQDAAIRDRRERFLALIEGILREIDRAGEHAVNHPARATLALLGMMHRIMLSTPRPWPEDLADWIEGQFLFGVGGRPGG
jgi:AcrR family transcriptional regulator